MPSSSLSMVKDELAIHIKLTRKEVGCLVFDVIQDKDNIHKFTVYEEFTNRISFAAHQDRVRKSMWGKVTAEVERHYQITGVEE